MPNVNTVILIGTLTRDPELRATQGGQSVVGFSLAINNAYKTASGEKREEVTFIDVEAWGKLADLIAQYVHKGDPLYIDGRLRQDTWEDKTTRQKRSKIKVVASNMQFLESGKRDESAGPPEPQSQSPEQEAPDSSDIPF